MRSAGPMPACARSTTTAPRRRRRRPATTCSSSMRRRARRRCSRSSAARSPPTGAWPSRRSASSPARSLTCGGRGRRRRRCPGGDIKATLFGEWERNKGQRYPFLDPRLRVAALPRLRHARSTSCSRASTSSEDLGERLRRRPQPSARSTTWSRTNGRRPPTTSSGGARSSGCTSATKAARRWRRISRGVGETRAGGGSGMR